MALHEARVADTVVASRSTDASAGLLKHYGEDKAVIDAGFVSDLLDGLPDVVLRDIDISYRRS